jgi:hypothetical protein
VILLNEELLEHRVTAALEKADRAIMAQIQERGEHDDLFDEANNKGRREYAAMIVRELKLPPIEERSNADLAQERVALGKRLTIVIAEQLRRRQ